MMRFLIPIASLLLLAPHAVAQVEEAAGKLLNAVGKRYTDPASFHFEAVEATRTHSGTFDRNVRTRVVTALDAEGRSHVEFDDGSSGGVTVYDGETTWVYFPYLKKYTQFSGTPLQGGDLGKPGRVDFSAAAQRYTARYRSAADGLIGAKTLRTESIEVGGRAVECQVIEAQYKPPQGVVEGQVVRSYWIDPKERLILRELSSASMKAPSGDGRVEVRQAIEFREAKVGTDLPRSLFVFQPPPGVEQVGPSDFAGPAAANWNGKAAPDFTLHDLAGHSVKLADLRGQIVVLDFWATWCGPCRIDMPRIDALHQELKDKGLRVFGVNGEDAEVARAFLERNGYTFPTLSDPGMQVSRLYDVSAIPTAVVIDKEGKIGAYLQGSGTKERLMEAIHAAGL